MERVAIRRCEDYDYQNVEKAVFECLDSVNGIREKIVRGSKVLLKVNLLMRKRPDEAVTTHPAVVEAVARYLQNMGCSVIIGDSPGGPFIEPMLRSIYKIAGMTEVASKTGCTLNYDTSISEIVNDKAKYLKNMQIIKVAEDVDFVISLAKLKTHGMMTYTGAVKNLFGVIPGIIKAEYHFKMNDVDNFAGHLIDICEYVQPAFSLIDAVEGMEGDGPSAGDKRQVGLILASENPYALDVIGAGIMKIDPMIVPTIKAAKDRLLSTGSSDDIEIDGVQLKDIQIAPFKLPKSCHVNFVAGRVPKYMERFVLKTFRPTPVFDYKKCVSCGDCARSCPAGIIDMTSGKPVPNLEKCIRCFCCHELCPKKAVDIKKHWLHEKLFK